jgi:hypothetical protein
MQKYRGPYYKELYANKLDNLEHMGWILLNIWPTKTELWRNRKSVQTNNNKSCKSVEFKKCQAKRRQKFDDFPSELYQTFKEELTPTLLNCFQT